MNNQTYSVNSCIATRKSICTCHRITTMSPEPQSHPRISGTAPLRRPNPSAHQKSFQSIQCSRSRSNHSLPCSVASPRHHGRLRLGHRIRCTRLRGGVLHHLDVHIELDIIAPKRVSRGGSFAPLPPHSVIHDVSPCPHALCTDTVRRQRRRLTVTDCTTPLYF